MSDEKWFVVVKAGAVVLCTQDTRRAVDEFLTGADGMYKVSNLADVQGVLDKHQDGKDDKEDYFLKGVTYFLDGADRVAAKIEEFADHIKKPETRDAWRKAANQQVDKLRAASQSGMTELKRIYEKVVEQVTNFPKDPPKEDQ
jgi:hypothetical protein